VETPRRAHVLLYCETFHEIHNLGWDHPARHIWRAGRPNPARSRSQSHRASGRGRGWRNPSLCAAIAGEALKDLGQPKRLRRRRRSIRAKVPEQCWPLGWARIWPTRCRDRCQPASVPARRRARPACSPCQHLDAQRCARADDRGRQQGGRDVGFAALPPRGARASSQLCARRCPKAARRASSSIRASSVPLAWQKSQPMSRPRQALCDALDCTSPFAP
jgi:hypothetical protein